MISIMIYHHFNLMMKTAREQAQESKEDDQRAVKQGCKGSERLLHPGDDADDGGGDGGKF